MHCLISHHLGRLEKIVNAFLPRHTLNIQFSSGLERAEVAFHKLEIHQDTLKIQLHCNITEDFYLVQNVVNGNGISIILEADLARPQETLLEIKGTGTTAILEQLVRLVFEIYLFSYIHENFSFQIAV